MLKKFYLPPLPDELEEEEEERELPPDDLPEGALLPLEREGEETLGLDDLEGGGLLLLEGLDILGGELAGGLLLRGGV